MDPVAILSDADAFHWKIRIAAVAVLVRDENRARKPKDSQDK
jgi:hypothetical protein